MSAITLTLPFHVTGFWVIHEHRDPRLTGSTGAGLLLEPGAIVRVVRIKKEKGQRLHVVVNNRKTTLCVAEKLNNMYDVRDDYIFHIESMAPLGAGFALSAIIAISIAFTLYKNGIKSNNTDSYSVNAHISEVKCRTGLGDVIALLEAETGLELRVHPGAPGFGKVLSIPVQKPYPVLGVVIRRDIDTPSMLRIYREKILKYGKMAFKEFTDNPCLEEFLRISQWFSRATGMLDPKLEEEIGFLEKYKRRGSLLGYYVKKNVLIAVFENRDDMVEASRELPEKIKKKVIELQIARFIKRLDKS